MCLLRAGAHSGSKDPEVSKFPFAARRQLFESIVLDAKPCQQLLRALLEAVDQSLDTACQQRRTAAAIDGQHHRGLRQHIVQVSLKSLRRLIDLLFTGLTTTVGIERKTDYEGDQHRIDQG